MMEKPHSRFKPHAGDQGKPYGDEGPTLQGAIDYAANAILQLREDGGEDTDDKGNSEPINERQYARGLIRLFMGKRAPMDDGKNCERGDINVQIDRVMALAYRLGRIEARG